MKMRKTRKSREVPVEAQGKYADEERRSRHWFLESMDRINRTIQGTDDLERTMGHALDAALSVFGCDRAWLVYPCDPESQTWRTVIERARPGFADSSFLGRDFPMDAEVAHTHRIVRSSEAAVRFGLRSDNPIPAEIAERFSVRSLLLLEDAKTLLRKRKLCPKKLCHSKRHPTNFGPTSVQFKSRLHRAFRVSETRC